MGGRGYNTAVAATVAATAAATVAAAIVAIPISMQYCVANNISTLQVPVP